MRPIKRRKREPEQPQTLRDAMVEVLNCCEVWGVVAVVKQGDTTVTLDNEAFVDVLTERDPGDGFEKEVILITSDEVRSSYHKTFKPPNIDPTPEQIETWLEAVMGTLQGRIRAIF